MANINFNGGDRVRHERYGSGTVEFDKGATVLVRFEHGYEEIEKDTLTQFSAPHQAITDTTWHAPIGVITRVQAAAILSINDGWGVFTRSKIDLLPHQLWVCRKINENWPTRWLVADDVGLGKTIEAGLILLPLITRGLVKRLLILCPASIVDQWQQRMREMFDIRLATYVSEADTARSDFWNTHNYVVASFHTLRMDNAGRHDRLVESPEWDLVIVDEAHHLNSSEDSGPTQAYKLVSRLQEERRVVSMVFFTGTPHRGMNYAFLNLLKLLRPDYFDPRKDMLGQLSLLQNVLIRNNKQSVTDLEGNLIFKPPVVYSEIYSYNEHEEIFYRMLTDFISSGQMYANRLSSNDGRAVMLVLTAMQKLASSSVSAIRKALKRRLGRIHDGQSSLKRCETELYLARDRRAKYVALEDSYDNDDLSKLEEKIDELTSDLMLVEDEIPRLNALIAAADMVGEETKIEKILEILRTRFADRQVVFFTEYKATQALLISRLFQEFGNNCATFINGDDSAEGVVDSSGKKITLNEPREVAAENFNSGKVRFIVSTEAGGEGIDLQDRCNSLIHVDLPWNPMRLHQRVGRINRYGQKHQVEVVNLRNPDTIEARIWDKLNEKLDNIMTALGAAMDEPEDLLQLVLGMTSPKLFREIFSEGAMVRKESLSTWFDSKSRSFGGQDVIGTVKKIVGNCDRFDFSKVSALLPKVDLPALQPFFEAMLVQNGRRVKSTEEGLSFKSPDSWRNDPAVRSSYSDMKFDRSLRGPEATKRVLGIGHKVVDKALRQALDETACVTTLPQECLELPLLVFRIFDRVTGEQTSRRSKIVALTPVSEENWQLIDDWELLVTLNGITGRGLKADFSPAPERTSEMFSAISHAENSLEAQRYSLDLPFKHPVSELFAVIWPR